MTLGRKIILLALVGATWAHAGQLDITLTEKQWAKLDTFEAHSLSRADQLYASNKKLWREAVAEYDAFVAEFPTSKVIPYALVKKGLALENDDKRYKAIEAYQELLDYFPNVVYFAAPALYYMGRCHESNGDQDKALKLWAEMVSDVDYMTHPLAAHALNALAANLWGKKRFADAVKYYTRTAVEFKKTNFDARRTAMNRVIYFHVHIKPNEPALRAFYTDTGTFSSRPHAVAKDLDNDKSYWSNLKSYAWQYRSFPEEQKALGKRYWDYWAGQLNDKFPKDDDFQWHVAQLYLLAEDDAGKWMQRMDAQFDKYQQEADFDRISKWIKWYRAYPKKVDAYYQKYNFSKMTDDQIIAVLMMFYSFGNKELARALLEKPHYDEMSDGAIARLGGRLWGTDDEMVEPVLRKMRNVDDIKWHTLNFFHGRFDYLKTSQHKRCVPLAEEITQSTSDKRAQEAWHCKAHFHHWRSQFQEAINAYHQADKPPATLWEIVDAYLGWGKPEQAIQQLLEIENFFKNHAPRAALRIAHVYRDTGKRKLQVANLRGVLKKYPKTGQSSQAHVELEQLGEALEAAGEGDGLVKIGGGTKAE